MDEPQVRAAIQARIALYREKQKRRDPFADDAANPHEMCDYAVEVLEWLAADLGIKLEAECES